MSACLQDFSNNTLKYKQFSSPLVRDGGDVRDFFVALKNKSEIMNSYNAAILLKGKRENFTDFILKGGINDAKTASICHHFP